MAVFKVMESFAISGRNTFVLMGALLEGEIYKGMSAQLVLNSALTIPLLVDSVEDIRKGEETLFGLCVKCEDDDEVELLVAMNIYDEEITVI